MYGELADSDLLPLIAAANHDAFAALVARHTDKFFALAFRTLHNQDDAEDVVQAAFIKLWQKPQAWDPRKSQFTTWFYRVIINACHDCQRKRKKIVRVSEEVFEAALEPISGEQDKLESAQLQRWQQHSLELAIRRLSASQRDALNLVVYCELPQKQVAQVMGTSVKAVESLLVRAKRSIALSVDEMQAGLQKSERIGVKKTL